MTLPNYLTLFRVLAVPFFFTSLLTYNAGKEEYRWIAFSIFLVASITDALDGILARMMNKQSKLGEVLDPIADKLLLLSGFLGLLFVDRFMFTPPLWVTVTIVFRDLVIIVGFIVIFTVKGKVHVEPNMLGKATTAFQMASLTTILLQWPAAVSINYITAGFTILSLASYVKRGVRDLNNESK